MVTVISNQKICIGLHAEPLRSLFLPVTCFTQIMMYSRIWTAGIKQCDGNANCFPKMG
jgi:hypothetical protein